MAAAAAGLTAAERQWQLLYAAERGDAAAAERLLKAGANANVVVAAAAIHRYAGWRPLVLAAHRGHANVVKVLLQHGADASAATAWGDSALHYAARFGHLDVTRLLLDCGASTNAATTARPDRDNNSFASCQPLHYAAYHSHAAVVELLLSRGADVCATAARGSTTGVTPLHLAAGRLGDRTPHEAEASAIVRALLDAGAPVDAADSDGWQALHFAARQGCIEFTRLLLDRGVNVNAATALDGTALHCAARHDRPEVARLLLERGADVNAAAALDRTALHCAAQHGSIGVVRLLLDAGATANATTAPAPADSLYHLANCQPLHLAAYHCHAEVVELLLGRGADVRATAARRNCTGVTALHFAASRNGLEVVPALLQAGVPIDAADSTGRQALHWAARQGALDMAELLLARGADVKAADNAGTTPLHLTCRYVRYPEGYDALEMAQLLLGAGADVNAPLLESGRTPLHLAASSAELLSEYSLGGAVVAELLERGADARAADADGRTPLHGACDPQAWPLREVVEALLEGGADARAADARGRQPLHCLAAHQRPADWDREEISEGTVTDDFAAVVKALQSRGADIDAVDAENRTPLMLALANENADDKAAACAALQRCGARVGPPDCGRCAAAAAARSNTQRIVLGMAAEAARLRQERAALEQERSALAEQQAAMAHQQAAWEQERAAWERQQAALQLERAALEAARGGGSSSGAQPQNEEPVAKRARRSGC